jgi:hypothetical protein
MSEANRSNGQGVRIRLSGLWEQTSERGVKYLGGSLGGARLLVFPNTDRRTTADPTHVLYVVPREDPARAVQARGQSATPSAPASGQNESAAGSVPARRRSDEDGPF